MESSTAQSMTLTSNCAKSIPIVSCLKTILTGWQRTRVIESELTTMTMTMTSMGENVRGHQCTQQVRHTRLFYPRRFTDHLKMSFGGRHTYSFKAKKGVANPKWVPLIRGTQPARDNLQTHADACTSHAPAFMLYAIYTVLRGQTVVSSHLSQTDNTLRSHSLYQLFWLSR